MEGRRSEDEDDDRKGLVASLWDLVDVAAVSP